MRVKAFILAAALTAAPGLAMAGDQPNTSAPTAQTQTAQHPAGHNQQTPNAQPAQSAQDQSGKPPAPQEAPPGTTPDKPA